MKTVLGILMALLLAGCQTLQLPLTPQDIQARKFEAVPGAAVIYLVRDNPDFTGQQSMVWLGDKIILKTYPGTYFRWEVPPGEHRIQGANFDTGGITIAAEAGKLYFVQQRVTLFFTGNPNSYFQVVPEPAARAAVGRSVLLSPDKNTF